MATRFTVGLAGLCLLLSCSDGSSAKRSQSTAPIESESNDPLSTMIARGGVAAQPTQLEDTTTPICPDGSATSCPRQELRVSDSNQFTCTLQSYRIHKTPSQFVVLNPQADVLWPGSLIQGRSLPDGSLTPVPIKERAPGEITLTMATGSSAPFSASIDQPSLGTTTDAINRIIAQHMNGPTPAKFSYELQDIHSFDQLMVSIAAQAKIMGNEVAASLKFDGGDEKSRVLVSFTQEYYTMAFSPPQGQKGLLGPGVKAQDLEPYVGPGNPMLYMSSVTYGRKFYFLFESTASRKDLAAAIRASLDIGTTPIGGSVEAKYQHIVNNSSVKAYGIGGNAIAAIKAATGAGVPAGKTKLDLVHNYLLSDANFDQDTPGVPISYTLRNVANGDMVRVDLATDYEAKDCAPVDGIQAPLWTLKVTLDRLKMGQMCDASQVGDFYTCLQARPGTTGNFTNVLCQTRDQAQKVVQGKEVVYGHSALIKVPQRAGEKFEIRTSVFDRDVMSNDDVILPLNTRQFELSSTGQWLDFGQGQVSVRGQKCDITMDYHMEWIDQPQS